jgi:hypothetical protein
MAFYQIEPFGEPWKQAGTIAAMVGNTVGKKDGSRFEPQEFYPVKPPQTEDEIEAALMKALGQPKHG